MRYTGGFLGSLGLGHPFSKVKILGCRKCREKDRQIKELKDKYYELIMAVANKYKDETRHETALRYIRTREQHSGERPDAERREGK